MTPNTIIDCGWGRLLMGQTFASQRDLVEALIAETPQQRDVALYAHDPHVLVALAPLHRQYGIERINVELSLGNKLDEQSAAASALLGVVNNSSAIGLIGKTVSVLDDEIFVVIEGRGTVTDQHGRTIDLAPGVVGVLHPDDETTWVITEPLRKVWIVRSSD